MTVQNVVLGVQSMSSITLEEMKSIRLMNRIDTKYLTTLPVLEQLLHLAGPEYRVQEANGQRILPYYTLYYDTPDYAMFLAHQNGKMNRQKVRVRSYLSSGDHFLEVKNKNNKGRTHKKRIGIEAVNIKTSLCQEFLERILRYPVASLCEGLENQFNRITLVNHRMTERLTIDTQLEFHHLHTDKRCNLENLVVIELKRDGNTFSPVREMLRDLHVHPAGFSKYCMGSVLTNSTLKYNRFKPKLRALERLLN